MNTHSVLLEYPTRKRVFQYSLRQRNSINNIKFQQEKLCFIKQVYPTAVKIRNNIINQNSTD